jgi:nitroreductase
MEVMEAIFGRRSVRDYLPEPLPQEAISGLIDAAIQAPSALNHQPWRFDVIRQRFLLDRMSDEAKKHIVAAGRLETMPEQLIKRLADPNFHIFYHAPALIVISAIAQGPWIVEDCALAAENLMLAAHAAGFGSCWIGLAQAWLATPNGKMTICIPETSTPVAPIIIGFPRTPAPFVPRKAPDVHWIG